MALAADLGRVVFPDGEDLRESARAALDSDLAEVEEGLQKLENADTGQLSMVMSLPQALTRRLGVGADPRVLWPKLASP